MREEIKKMEQAVASSSSFIKGLKGRGQQQTALNKAISNFWDTSDVPPEPAPTNITSYPSMASLDEERREELTEAQYKYYNLKRAILVEKMTVANEIYLAHLQNYEAEVNLQHKEYQKESFRLLRFCRKMIEKKDKEAGYIELEQPESVPNVKSITGKELDQKLREAHVEPQQVDPIGGNTIPPYYSREISRYELAIPVQEKEKQEALEKGFFGHIHCPN